jgi:hypothetical protein
VLEQSHNQEDFVSNIPIFEQVPVTTVEDDIVVTYLEPGQSIGQPTRLYAPDEPTSQRTQRNESKRAEHTPRKNRRNRGRFGGIGRLMTEAQGVPIS